MRKQMTNYQLMLLRDDINKQANESPAFAIFNQEKISRFFNKNAITLKILSTKVADIKKEHCILGEDGEPLTHEVDGRKEIQFATDEAKKACTDQITEFLNRTVTVEL